MYEYESDYGDEEDGKRKSRKTRGKAPKSRGKEDIASKAIEKPYLLPDSVGGFGSGAFPHIKV